MKRREFLTFLAASANAAPKLTYKQRVDRALAGRDVDRPPFTFWYHFLLEKLPPERHAEATLSFHRRLRTDLVKVMSDFPYPKPAGNWYQLKIDANPFPSQIRALELIRDGLKNGAYFVETIFNPWNVAEKLSSAEEVQRLKAEKPQALLDALEVIAKSEANHARKAIQTGASGVFLAIANAQHGILSPAEYARFSEPFDKMVLDAVRSAPLNTLHLHGDRVYLEPFFKGWAATAINYGAQGTGVPLEAVRKNFSGVLMGGLEHANFRSLSEAQLKQQWQAAQSAAGKRFILAPGCSVPNDTTDAELLRLVRVLGA